MGRNAIWRFGGVLALAAAGGTTLLHRSVLAADIGGPASGLELVLGLASFVLASAGVLLLIHGVGLHDGWVRDRERAERDRNAGLAPQRAAEDQPASPNAITADPCALAGGRAGLAMFLADRAVRATADCRKDAPPQPENVKAGHSAWPNQTSTS